MLKVKGLEKRIEQESIYDENFKDVRTHRQKRESEYKTKVSNVCILSLSVCCDIWSIQNIIQNFANSLFSFQPGTSS